MTLLKKQKTGGYLIMAGRKNSDKGFYVIIALIVLVVAAIAYVIISGSYIPGANDGAADDNLAVEGEANVDNEVDAEADAEVEAEADAEADAEAEAEEKAE